MSFRPRGVEELERQFFDEKVLELSRAARLMSMFQRPVAPMARVMASARGSQGA